MLFRSAATTSIEPKQHFFFYFFAFWDFEKPTGVIVFGIQLLDIFFVSLFLVNHEYIDRDNLDTSSVY